MSLALAITRNAAIPLRLRKKIGKCMVVPDNLDFSIDVFGHSYSGRTDTHLDRKVYQYGLHESATIRLLRDLLAKRKGRAVYLDIGTNTGLHMLGVAGIADAAYGFEPWEKVRKQAEANFAANNLLNFIVFPFGLSDKDAVLPFRLPQGNNLGVGAFMAENEKSDTKLEVKNGDQFLAGQNIIPAAIKIDVEGHEKQVLGGLKQTLAKHKPYVIFEYGSDTRRDFKTLADLKAVFGDDYQFYGIRRSRETPSLGPFDPAKKWENVLASPGEL